MLILSISNKILVDFNTPQVVAWISVIPNLIRESDNTQLATALVRISASCCSDLTMEDRLQLV